jgi:hypothetical protein
MLRRVRAEAAVCAPLWASGVLILVVLPALLLWFDYLVHLGTGMPNLKGGMIAAGSLSLLSSLFNWYLMSRGSLLVGIAGGSFATDLKRLPLMLFDFVSWVPRYCYLCLVHAGNPCLRSDDYRILNAGADPGPRPAALMLLKNAHLVPFRQFLMGSSVDLVDTPGRCTDSPVMVVSRRYVPMVPSVTARKQKQREICIQEGETDYGFAFMLPPTTTTGPAVSVLYES